MRSVFSQELFRVVYSQQPWTADKSLQDGGRWASGGRKPHGVSHLCPHARREGRMDPQHQVCKSSSAVKLRKRLLFWAVPLTSVHLSRVQISRQCRPFLWDARCQEEAYIAEEERGTALIYLQHIPQLLPAQNTSCPWTSVFRFPHLPKALLIEFLAFPFTRFMKDTQSKELPVGCRRPRRRLLFLSVLSLTFTRHTTVRAHRHSGFLRTFSRP